MRFPRGVAFAAVAAPPVNVGRGNLFGISDSLLAVIVSAAATLAGIVWTQRATKRAAARTAELEMERVDAQAYERARKFDQEVMLSHRAEVDRLTEQVISLRGRLSTIEDAQDTTRRERDRACRDLDDARRTVDRLNRLVVAADLTLPADLRRSVENTKGSDSC